VEFTFTYTYSGFNDQGSAQGSADLLFNGVQVLNIQRPFCLTPPLLYCPGGDTQQVVNIVDEPITYGVPFTYEADDSLSILPNNVNVSNQVTISISVPTGGTLVEIPEPGTLSFCAISFLVFLLWRSRRIYQPRRRGLILN
jgi:hypothetical protein